jgi:hypothetical protein
MITHILRLNRFFEHGAGERMNYNNARPFFVNSVADRFESDQVCDITAKLLDKKIGSNVTMA